MREYDVVVVGGGPAGCMAAKYAAKGGASTLIIEADAEIGLPVQCAGLISKRALRESELRENSHNSFIENEIKGAVVRSLSAELVLHAQDKRALAIRRDLFDQELAKAAQKEGAEIILGCRVKDMRQRAGIGAGNGERKLRLATATATTNALANGAEEIRAKVVIGADGVNSSIAKLAGLAVKGSCLNCAQIEGNYEMGRESFAEIFVGRTIAPGFFAWAIPLASNTYDHDYDLNRARIGLCIDKRSVRYHSNNNSSNPNPNPWLFLKRNLAEHPVMAKRYKGGIFNRTSGSIPIPANSTTISRRYKTVKIDKESGILLVGDAAAQIKPITGGGLYYGMKCGKIAGEIAAKACLMGDMTLLNDYENRWQKEIGKEIAFGLMVHRLRCVMSEKDFDTIFQTLSRDDILMRIKKDGDIDYPSIVFREFLMNPSLISIMARNIPKYLFICKRKSDFR